MMWAMSHRMPYRISQPLSQGLSRHTLALVCALSLAGSLPALAAEPATITQEVQGLFQALQKSGCEFSRNGNWYNATEASGHLQRKYEYLQNKNLVPNTEAFIERAASQSSMSGKPYRVRCAGKAEEDSKAWFTRQLQVQRR